MLEGIQGEVMVYSFLMLLAFLAASWVAHEAWRMVKLNVAMIMDQVMVAQRNANKATNAIERTLGIDLDRDGDVGVVDESPGKTMLGLAGPEKPPKSKPSTSSGMCC